MTTLPEEAAALRGLDTCALAFAAWEASGRLVEANDAFARLLGYPRDELLASGASWGSLTPPEHHAAEEAALVEAARCGFVRELRKPFIRKDGSQIWVVLVLLPTHPGRSGHAVFVIDDSERRSPERLRQDTWNRYRQFLDAAPDLVLLRDSNARILWANRAFLDFHRTEQGAIVGLDAPPGRSAEATARELAALATVRETGLEVELPPEPLQRVDSAVRFFYTTCQRFTDAANGSPVTISVSRDATHRAHAEQALARSEANLRTAQAIARIGSWELHFPHRGDDYWSEETFHILGLDPRQEPFDPERYVNEIIHPDDRIAARGALAYMAPHERRFDQEYRIVRPDGSVRWVRIKANLVRDAQGEIESIVGTLRDVTDQKHADAIRERLESRLRQAQKLEAMGTLAGGIAHDFNNLLGALSGYAELALETTRDNLQAQADLQQVLLAASRGADLVSRILTFSRQQDVPHRPIRIEPPVRDAVKLLRATLPGTIAIQESIDAETPCISGDETQLLQVMMNLGTNALHGMQDRGGVLQVRVEPFLVTPALAEVQAELSPGLHARLSVSDTGSGIAPQLLDRVLEPFFTTKPPGVGTGLGLSIVHGIVRDHGGAVEVESVLDFGTTVRVYLPAVNTPLRSLVPERTELPLGRGQRILVVDDEPALAELERRRLEELGYAPLAFTDARRALAAFKSQPTQFDLVFTDQSMPYVTGVELAREIRAVRPDLPVILVSGHGDTVHPATLEAAGICALLAKPVDRRRLAVAVAAALDEP
jgi:PAS domain S-box-containing protein